MDEQANLASQGELPKGRTGVPGFDEISWGGLPRGATTLLCGGPGTGKTVFALQTLAKGARDEGEPGIFVTFEESTSKVRNNALSFGWDVAALERDNKLFFLNARPSAETIQSGKLNLEGMIKTLSAKIAEMGAKRIVLDSIDVLLAMFDSRRTADHELRRLHDWLAERSGDLMGILTARGAGLTHGADTYYPFLPFVADCVVLLHSRVSERLTLRELRILKYRGSAVEGNEFPFTIGPQGIEVGSFSGLEQNITVSRERVSTGVQRLDAMLDGGYFRNSCVLITGSPGTAKTTLAGSFAQAACRRGERVLYIAFDETASEVVRNLASVNIQFAPFQENGLLHIHYLRALARNTEEHLIRITTLIKGYAPHAVVIDPLSALVRSGGQTAALTVTERLQFLTKSMGVMLLVTSLEEVPNIEASRIPVSTIADVWIRLSYIATAGERNRALSIVKARGVSHSNQVRELVLSGRGVTLTDVYTAGGAVLLGTLRAEREAEERLEHARMQGEVARRRRKLEVAEAETNGRIRALEQELAARREELEQFEQEERLRREIMENRQSAVGRLRQVDVSQREANKGDATEGSKR